LNNLEITQEEYEELVLDLLTDPKSQFEILDVPTKDQTYRQWVEWKLKPPGRRVNRLSPQSYNLINIDWWS
jgi:hypothetical protein